MPISKQELPNDGHALLTSNVARRVLGTSMPRFVTDGELNCNIFTQALYYFRELSHMPSNCHRISSPHQRCGMMEKLSSLLELDKVSAGHML